jgi:predicted transcriptional regulator
MLLNAPLYEKPAIGLNPFTPMEGSRPDKTADGIKEVMKAMAETYDKNPNNLIGFARLINSTSIHRLAFSRYLNEAIKLELIYEYNNELYSITDAGINYLEQHKIIDF